MDRVAQGGANAPPSAQAHQRCAGWQHNIAVPAAEALPNEARIHADTYRLMHAHGPQSHSMGYELYET